MEEQKDLFPENPIFKAQLESIFKEQDYDSSAEELKDNYVKHLEEEVKFLRQVLVRLAATSSVSHSSRPDSPQIVSSQEEAIRLLEDYYRKQQEEKKNE